MKQIIPEFIQNSMTLIRYEDFAKDKIGTIVDLAKKVGLITKYDISEQINVQYQPRGNHDINLLDFFGDNLHRINDICADRMEIFKYDIS